MPGHFQIFFTQHLLFSVNELRQNLNYRGTESSLYSLLRYHLKKGHVRHVKNGLYAYVPPGTNPQNVFVDSYLLASKLAKDAVIGYQSALGYWGKLYSMRNDLVYLTSENVSQPQFSFEGIKYKAVFFPKRLVQHKNELFGVSSVDRVGEKILVTSLERTFVDVLDRFYMMNDWEEIYRSFEAIGYLNLDKVVEYVLMLENATTIAKVGFFLEQFKEVWFVEDKHLNQLRNYIPKKPLYIDRKSKKLQKLVKQWNIIVPESLLIRDWEEPYYEGV